MKENKKCPLCEDDTRLLALLAFGRFIVAEKMPAIYGTCIIQCDCPILLEVVSKYHCLWHHMSLGSSSSRARSVSHPIDEGHKVPGCRIIGGTHDLHLNSPSFVGIFAAGFDQSIEL
ncbi:hypothetical protein MPTK1_2g11960 [Marchantia polymorpha subsp. ruderalis]|uniref:Uncharacterized protein n=1 Tax=Marchantia polymorpha TaxID=3197 RepID=A0A2R6XCN3_MARPO|nr:hypothetical protein MARPO_0023s0161 [Marchantia polymorpha]BBN02005.1 hypothetical protein Mp_2g11960 [Marchantia polymorpha subsp. ruderalis]|eukprot:PTQ43867.1 hypothetical protein MARPO_0023s0161 [Marchantia polymorpha]